HAEEDRRRRDEIEVRNEADNAAYQAEKTLREVGDKVSADIKSDVESKIADVRAALGTDDIERMRTAKDALQTAMLKIGEALYASAGAAGGAPGGAEGEGSGPTDSNPTDDNTVEGEFKEM
ncbi:MAG TPA: Hsp70 family protein, partial [Gemmatimonadaceae bacterium]